ncbi:hypothetical protein NDU88_000151 [Pleurodeles waltl]|uniref:Uncharacterized protein n=1 Tax=Pleurodeles waltl TaxID=8319 RepID=A0AAV7KN93_PLEWA|nr:hypothetical protein NDU88_000151 [Pleurodeles waltl]
MPTKRYTNLGVEVNIHGNICQQFAFFRNMGEGHTMGSISAAHPSKADKMGTTEIENGIGVDYRKKLQSICTFPFLIQDTTVTVPYRGSRVVEGHQERFKESALIK